MSDSLTPQALQDAVDRMRGFKLIPNEFVEPPDAIYDITRGLEVEGIEFGIFKPRDYVVTLVARPEMCAIIRRNL